MENPRTTDAIYQLKVALQEIEPPIWRQIQVPSSITLAQLHNVLQEAMGWENYHLYDFDAAGQHFGEPDPDDDFNDRNVIDAGATKLSTVASQVGATLRYEYDFGDGWEHEIIVERVMEPEKSVHYPVVIDGERACPPED